jgi:hypothetical protein
LLPSATLLGLNSAALCILFGFAAFVMFCITCACIECAGNR